MGIEEAILTYVKEQTEAENAKNNTFGMLDEGLSPEAIVRIAKFPLATILDWKKEWKAQQA